MAALSLGHAPGRLKVSMNGCTGSCYSVSAGPEWRRFSIAPWRPREQPLRYYFSATVVILSLIVAAISFGSRNDLYDFVDSVSKVVRLSFL